VRYRQRLPILAALLIVVIFASAPSNGQQSEVAALNAKISALGNAGRFSEAVPLAQRVLAIIEPQLRPDDPNLAPALTRLADLYKRQHLYSDAEPLYVRALTLRQKALGPDHVDVAQSLENLADLYSAEGRAAEAEPLFAQASDIRQSSGSVKASGPIPRRTLPSKSLGVR
jgi:tetratricopeptide (TPR) repeat protein